MEINTERSNTGSVEVQQKGGGLKILLIGLVVVLVALIAVFLLRNTSNTSNIPIDNTSRTGGETPQGNVSTNGTGANNDVTPAEQLTPAQATNALELVEKEIESGDVTLEEAQEQVQDIADRMPPPPPPIPANLPPPPSGQ